MTTHPPYWRLVVLAAFVGICLLAVELSGFRTGAGLEFVRQRLVDHWFGGFAIFVALFSLGNLLQIPGLMFLAAAVLAIGRLWGGVATYLAATIASTISFLIVRWIGGNALRRLDNRLVARILGQIDAYPIRSVFLTRLLFQSAPALNATLALAGIRLRPYVIGTSLGLALPVALYCVFFDFLVRLAQPT